MISMTLDYRWSIFTFGRSIQNILEAVVGHCVKWAARLNQAASLIQSTGSEIKLGFLSKNPRFETRKACGERAKSFKKESN